MKETSAFLLAALMLTVATTGLAADTASDGSPVSMSVDITPDGVICTIAMGKDFSSWISGPDLCFRDEFAEFWISGGHSKIGNPGWQKCEQSRHLDSDGYYEGCFVAIYPRGGGLPSTRSFEGSTISASACDNWCFGHMPEEDEGIFDRLYTCTNHREHTPAETHAPYDLSTP